MQALTKKSLSAITLAAAATLAHADGVSIYALLDAGIAGTSISGPGTTASKTEFVTGGYAPNFVGLTAEKGMGGGISGGFKLEQGFLLQQPASGTSRFAFGDDALFNRNANLYLKGAYGTGTVGTQANIAFNSVLLGDPRNAPDFGSSLAAIVISGGLGTIDNGAVSYTSPTMSGVTLAASYVPETATVNSGTRFSVTYGTGPIKATLAAYKTDVIGEAVNRTGTVAGAAYAMGPFNLKALYTKQKTATFDSLTTVGLGGDYAVTSKVTVDFGVYRSSDSGTDYKMNTSGVGVMYKFLKDLSAYAQYASVKNDGTASTPFNFAPPTLLTGGITSGQTASTFNVGLLYAFF